MDEKSRPSSVVRLGLTALALVLALAVATLGSLRGTGEEAPVDAVARPIGGSDPAAARAALLAGSSANLDRRVTQARSAPWQTARGLGTLGVILGVGMLAAGAQASRHHLRALRWARDTEAAMTEKLKAIARGAAGISDALSRSEKVDCVLETTVQSARAAVDADWAALGMGTDPERSFDPFVSAGLERSALEGDGAPRPTSVLGSVIQGGRAIRVDQGTQDPGPFQMPAGHPVGGPFLGVPLHREGKAVGILYLGRRPGSMPFSVQDAHATDLLAAVSASAIQSAKLCSELRREVRTREDLLSVVSHDLRGPLSTIAMAGSLLQRTLASDACAKRRADMIVRNVARMDRMIADLLTAARVHEGTLSIEPAVQYASALVAESVEELAGSASAKGIELRTEVAEGTPPVYCDAARIAQVLSNLIGNAVKFTPAGGSIVVSAGPDAQHPREVCFSVRDTGVGIAQEAIHHVFDRYWQRKEHASLGTGLGLFIAKGIVESHRGRVWVTSCLGQGSDFRFTLAVAGSPGDEPRPPRAR